VHQEELIIPIKHVKKELVRELCASEKWGEVALMVRRKIE
jgi:hypothetical protein